MKLIYMNVGSQIVNQKINILFENISFKFINKKNRNVFKNMFVLCENSGFHKNSNYKKLKICFLPYDFLDFQVFISDVERTIKF